MAIVVLTEKPSVARDIAAVLAVKNKGDGFLYNEQYKVTWAYGHLVGLAEPQQINPSWKVWRAQDLPLLPQSWPLEVGSATARQFQIVSKLLNDPSTEYIINAMDAGREGELIFRYIYEKASCQKPFKRLWISSLTTEAIRHGFAKLQSGHDFDGLADSARARSRADWLVGFNLSRGYSLSTREHFSVGRVQTPTLAMVVKRELEIRDFVPEDYIIIQARFFQNPGATYLAHLIDQPKASKSASAGKTKRFAVDDPEIDAICKRVPNAKIWIQSLTEKHSRLPPPQFFDLTELQRQANRLYGFSAEKTLRLAQSLYEESKLITYPRTDSRYVSPDIAKNLGQLAEDISSRYQDLIQEKLQFKELGQRFVDESKVSDHHAILPTGRKIGKRALPDEQAKIYDLICRRLVMAYMKDYQYSTTDAHIVAESSAQPSQEENQDQIQDYFLARGKRIIDPGWKLLELKTKSYSDQEKTLPSEMRQGEKQELEKIEAIKRQTMPPPRLTDASLLTAMETAGSTLDDKKLSEAMREKGLGTPATRSGIIETLIKREYMRREKQALFATEKGIKLIELVHDEVKSPGLTGEWERRLNFIKNKELSLKEFMEGIESFVRRTTAESLKAKPLSHSFREESKQQPASPSTATSLQEASQQSLPQKPHDLLALLKQRFGYKRFRSHQEAVCKDIVKGCDTLLVMPTGAGKSLCYQLPGLALGGRTLIISPLIALMDDQVSKLQEMGLKAAAIHSGKSREVSQEYCRQYATRAIEFLFVAPERLGVPGFVNFLARHKPDLIAIDEAHCISQWGHDFRYDYRRLTERLAPLRPAVIIAMTATATTRVQKDIVEQLALENPVYHIHGFRRTNIAIENVELSKSHRSAVTAKLLAKHASLPAIVYAPTRKETENTARYLKEKFRAAPYHAGMDADKRSQVQEAFLGGELDVIVATTAFGMGIDKSNIRTVVHLAVPGSLEAYYQEIGRAGRDGKLSRAILLYSHADMKTHEYFHRRNYPDLKELTEVYQAIPKKGIARDQVQLAMPPEDVASHIDRLNMIGALRLEDDGTIYPEKSQAWKKSYEEQKQYRYQQLMEMNRYVQQNAGCRMLRLMAHFGDEDANGLACGICDVCAPDLSLLKSKKGLSITEISLGKKLIDRLAKELRPVALGTLFRDIAEPLGWQRKDFDRLMDGLIQFDYLQCFQSTFNKSGEIIPFRTVSLKVKPEDIPWTTIQLSQLEKSLIPEHGVSKKRQKTAKAAKRVGASRLSSSVDDGLLERLRKWRKLEAQKRKLPAFCILTDRSLEFIASEKPRDQESLMAIHGIGQVKFEQFGQSILAILEKW